MQAMDRWDWLLLGGAVYVAVVTLVRLMTSRRNQVIAHLREQVEREQIVPASSGQSIKGFSILTCRGLRRNKSEKAGL